MSLDDALDALADGNPVVVYDADDREGEADMILPAADADWRDVTRLRTDAGGLVCVAVSRDAAERLDLPFRRDLLPGAFADGDEPYGDRSSFSLTLNHRDTYTGVTDRDRARTARELAAAVDRALDGGEVDLAGEFRSPGHVHVLRSSGLEHRAGHTELAVALLAEAEATPAALLAEMLDADTGEALSRADAEAYAERNGLPFLEGAEILDALDPDR